MQRVILSIFIALALITINTASSKSYAAAKIQIFKVTNVSPQGKLHLRAWPSTKSRIKKALPYNAKDLTETGKKRVINKIKWIEVNWKDMRGWVNSHYLTKTGVLLRSKSNELASSHASRNKNTVTQATKKPANILPIAQITAQDKMPNADNIGDRYDQPVQVSATELKTAYSKKTDEKQLICSGNSPHRWEMSMNMSNKKMRIQLSTNKTFSVPIKYHEWATPTKVRMSIGGSKGRNIVDVNLEKTDACNNGLSKTNFTYEINATINRQFYSGCCAVTIQ